MALRTPSIKAKQAKQEKHEKQSSVFAALQTLFFGPPPRRLAARLFSTRDAL